MQVSLFINAKQSIDTRRVRAFPKGNLRAHLRRSPGWNVAGHQCDYKRDLPEIGDRRQQPELDLTTG
jgi:hypothetical protein